MDDDSTMELRVRLSPEEAMSRIVEASDEERFAFSLSGYRGRKPFLLKRNANQFRVQRRRFYRNDFHPYLFASIEPDSCGSRISGHYAMATGTKVFIRIWFAGVGLFGVIFIIGLVSDYLGGKVGCSELLRILHPFGMLIAGYLIVATGKLLSRNEAREISEWLRTRFADVVVR
jgi:hypothetical protein